MQSELWFGLVLLALFAASIFTRNILSGRRRKFRAPSYPPPSYGTPRPSYIGDASDQLRIVMGASFHKKKIMNKAEYAVFRTIETHLRKRHSGYRVLSQTSLGEIIGSDDDLAFRSINSKRVDILIIDPFGFPVTAVEYQGSGHYQGDAAARDAVKKEALRKSGIHYLEITAAHPPEAIQQLVTNTIPAPTTRSATGA